MKVTLGGDRLGSEGKMTQNLHGYGRSTHDVGFIYKGDQSAGTLVPVACQLGTKGTTVEIDLDTKTRTLPTIGPAFAAFKQQIDVFVAPIRLFVGPLHNNALGIGLHMQDIKFPQKTYTINTIGQNKPTEGWKSNINSCQVSQDSLTAYLGVRGLGAKYRNDATETRKFHALFDMMYWQIYKNYYSNKQEGVGYVIGPETEGWGSWITEGSSSYVGTTSGTLSVRLKASGQVTTNSTGDPFVIKGTNADWYFRIEVPSGSKIPTSIQTERDRVQIGMVNPKYINPETPYVAGNLPQDYLIWMDVGYKGEQGYVANIIGIGPTRVVIKLNEGYIPTRIPNATTIYVVRMKSWTGKNSIGLKQFDLSNIDDVHEEMLATGKGIAYQVPTSNKLPYTASTESIYAFTEGTDYSKPERVNACYFDQAGLGIKTYLSDRFNNWLSTEWIDGQNGINEITAVEIVDGKLSMDALILQKKTYDMLNRIAVSDGSYRSWEEAVYGEKVDRIIESPIYVGGISNEIMFDEIVSNAASGAEPLGTLAGRGVTVGRKGRGRLKFKLNEASLIMVINSYTPRVDYSQGNKWWTMLETMNDLHKPAMDGIGFQDLLTEEMAAWDTKNSTNGMIYKGVGKQPSWTEYMTAVNECFGSFSAGEELSFMTLNRSYQPFEGLNNTVSLGDTTTYIDPVKYNVIFADTKLTAKNFWTQVKVEMKMRRKMSAKQMPIL